MDYHRLKRTRRNKKNKNKDYTATWNIRSEMCSCQSTLALSDSQLIRELMKILAADWLRGKRMDG